MHNCRTQFSYFATIQILGAAVSPPHLKAIFCNGGHYDIYEFGYHGGILWLMPRAAFEGRGGDSEVAVRNVKSKTQKMLSPEQYQARIRERLEDSDIKRWPNMTSPPQLSRDARMLDGRFVEPI